MEKEEMTDWNDMGIVYNYYVTLAITSCKREVKELNKYWAGTKLLSFDEIEYVFTAVQKVRILIHFAIEGISCIDIKSFPLKDYGNYVQIFIFKV